MRCVVVGVAEQQVNDEFRERNPAPEGVMMPVKQE
jgi:hypothetical protein